MVFDNSSVLFHGTLASNNNGFSGTALFRNSTANTYGDMSTRAHDNGRHGIIAATSSNMFTNRGVNRVEQNAGHGLFVWGGTLFDFQNAALA